MRLIFSNVLVTGAAGFIGYHLCQRLISNGINVTGIDNLNSYYDVRLKEARLNALKPAETFSFVRLDLADRNSLDDLFKESRYDVVVNLAAQAGVRYSIENPQAYVDSNLVGFVNILECCRFGDVKHLVFASYSSVYGANTAMPFSVRQNVDHPLALYGASKKANELMAHSYSHLYGLPTTGLRFFTVYGPYGRPDMAPIKFAKNIVEGRPIDVYNFGDHSRDFTYIDDIVGGVIATLDKTAQANSDWDPGNPDPGTSNAPYRIFNIGNQEPVELMRFIKLIEDNVGIKAELNLLPMQPGDVPDTWADTEDLATDTGYQPGTPIEVGVKNFVEWYLEFYQVDLKKN